MKTYRFKKSERLLKRSEFIRLKRTGQRIQNRYFIAEFTAGKFENTRLGITVTKKMGSAVKRNRMKRIIRECFRLNRQRISGNWDINIMVKKEADSIPFDQAFSSLQNIFNTMEKKV